MKIGYFYILLAGLHWGTTGTFARFLYARGITPLQLAFLRSLVAFLLLLAILALRRREELKVAPRDLPFLALSGLTGVSIFATSYFTAIDIVGISRAVFLLYSAPIFTTIIARLLLKEPLARAKVTALVASVGGLLLMTRLYNPTFLMMPALGIGTGLGAALAYSFQSLIGKVVLRKYSQWTVVVYTLGLGSLFLAPITGVDISSFDIGLRNWLILTAMSIVSTLLAFSFFYSGLKRVEASRASILATIEPVVASLLGFAIFSEALGPSELLGGFLIIAGAVLVQL